MRRLSFFLLFLLVAVFAAAEEKYADITIKVLKQETGKPVRNASVILHSVSSGGKQEKGGLNLKTDSEGKTTYQGIPYGKLRVQVIAKGLQTYGEDFEINEAQKQIEIKLKPPQDQYSIYDDKHPAPNAPLKK
ncbi:MAG TPA: carboxypeptidase-like regulatory domain-containing protein [Terriglobales bacterium]|nr:carboxypeptidase-like regulatory domain-containing protein [Terriglobales bacterium]